MSIAVPTHRKKELTVWLMLDKARPPVHPYCFLRGRKIDLDWRVGEWHVATTCEEDIRGSRHLKCSARLRRRWSLRVSLYHQECKIFQVFSSVAYTNLLEDTASPEH